MSRTFRAVPEWAKGEPWTQRPLYLRHHFLRQKGVDGKVSTTACASVALEVKQGDIKVKLNTYDDVSNSKFAKDRTHRVERRAVRQKVRKIVDDVMLEVEAEKAEEAAEIAEMEAMAEEFESNYTEEMFEADSFDIFEYEPPFPDESFFSDDVFGMWDEREMV